MRLLLLLNQGKRKFRKKKERKKEAANKIGQVGIWDKASIKSAKSKCASGRESVQTSVSANNEKPQPAVPKGSQKPGPEGWIRPAQKRNNKSFKIRPLLNPPSYAELGCALPAPTQKQRDFLKSHCLSKPAHSIDVYLTFTHSLLSQWDHLLSWEHFPVSVWTRDQNCTWHIDTLKQFGVFFLFCSKFSFAIAKLALQTSLCSEGNMKRRT